MRTENAAGYVGGATTCGYLTGGATGIGVMIWASVKYIQPALHNVDGISKVGADWITAGINLLGGLETAAGAGAIAGGLAFCCLAMAAVSCAKGAECAKDATTQAEEAPVHSLRGPGLV